MSAGDRTTQVALGLVVRFDVIAERYEVVVVELVDALVGADARRGEGLGGAGATDPEYIRECDLNALFAREVDSYEACHLGSSFHSARFGHLMHPDCLPELSLVRGGDLESGPGLRFRG